MRHRVWGLAAGLALAVLTAGCGGAGQPAAADGTLAVVATTTQLADFARNVGGKSVSVTQILKPNVDPHDYDPSPSDITAMGSAKVVVKNGVGLEKWLDGTLAAAGFTGAVADASTGIALRKGEGEESADGDPHIWQNPRNAKAMARTIAAAFTKADPAHAAQYQRNLESYGAQLDKLDAAIEASIAAVPLAARKIVTNHDAFGYYLDRYQLQFAGSIIPSFDTSAELSGTQIQDLVAKIKAEHVKAVFSESSLPPKTAETIGREAGVKVVAGEDSLYADTLGPQGSAGATYIGALTHNTDVIVRALT
jgi:zinc/manganese transport system substrate-binding protein